MHASCGLRLFSNGKITRRNRVIGDVSPLEQPSYNMSRLPLATIAVSLMVCTVCVEGIAFGQPPQLFLPLSDGADVQDDSEKLLEPKFFSRGTLVALNTAALLEGDGPVNTEISVFGLDSKACTLNLLESPI